MQDLLRWTGEYGVLLVFVGVLLESLGLPIPAMMLLIVAGAIAATGQISALVVMLATILACLLGEGVWFLAGRRYGGPVLRILCRISISPDSCVRQTESFFTRWGVRTLLVAKFVPGLATIAPPLAGALRVAPARFVGYAGLGATLYGGVFVGLGVAFHTQLEIVGASLARLGALAAYGLAGLFVCFLAYKWWDRRRFMLALRMARITVAELDALRRDGLQPVILDVRSDASRQIDPRWIPGARFVDLQGASEALADVSLETEVVVYCSCPNEASAARVARELHRRGFRRVRPLAGGLEAWAESGLALERAGAGEIAESVEAPLDIGRSVA
jgi:membrane protein DedA with SNARE-associated domain/rhodanese-related sulfurtransferase